MIYKYLSLSIAVTFTSFIVGMALNAILRKTDFYQNKLSNLNFIKNDKINKFIGVGVFKWIVKNTIFRFFNQKLKSKNKVDKIDLNKLRDEMTISEVEHLIGFIFVTIFALVKLYHYNFKFCLIMMIVNVVMNLYPSLLQQLNKRRIDRLIKRL